MTRSFAEGAITEEQLARMLQVALRAPSAGFAQGVDWLVLTDEMGRGRFFRATCDPAFLAEPGPAAGILRAGAILVPVADPSAYERRYDDTDKETSGLAGRSAQDWDVPYWIVDAAFGAMLALLAAEDEGLGALFFRLHRGTAGLEAEFGIPAGRVVIGAVAVGLLEDGNRGPVGSPGHRPRRAAGDATHFGSW